MATETDRAKERPRSYESNAYAWNLSRVPQTLEVRGRTLPHPARTCAVFVVHGMGQQSWTRTAAELRSGFEDALDAIVKWQQAHKVRGLAQEAQATLPPPFIYDGYWADYEDLAATFPDDWKRFHERERSFFGYLWKIRLLSIAKTYLWFLWQQLRLLRPTVWREVGWAAWFLYWPLQVVMFATLTVASLRYPRLIQGFLGDVRLYLDPRGIVEKAIVQRIDYRVGKAFLQMIGLDWDFRSLPESQRIEASGQRVEFEHVVWVAHSLGTVVSYNVLSDLFERAADLAAHGDPSQKEGVNKFRSALRRFVTMGSPLDKVAFLFKEKKSLRWWPDGRRTALVTGGESLVKDQPAEQREWWINFYHVLDPVSGALSNEPLCAGKPPANFHISFWRLPGLAHVAYWKDQKTLRFILGRVYGREFLPDQEYRPFSAETQSALAAVAYFIWAGILLGGAYLVIRATPWLFERGVTYLKSALGL